MVLAGNGIGPMTQIASNPDLINPAAWLLIGFFVVAFVAGPILCYLYLREG
jgi:hypothetical protein